MRFFAVIACCFALASAGPREDFCKKLISLGVVFWSEANLCKITDLLVNDLRAGLTMDAIGEKGLKYVTPNTPLMDYSKLMGLMTSMDKCLTPTKTKTFDVAALAMPVFKNVLTAPYNLIMDKMKKMKANKKTAAEMNTEAYKLALASATTPLVQKIITNSSKKMSAPQWTCAVQNLPKVFAINKYNTKRA